MAMGGVSITNRTRRRAPRLPFAQAAMAALPGWEISLVLVNPKEARALNKKLRRKTYTPNVLSYEVGKKSGEIILCLSVAKSEAPLYFLPFPLYLLYLFIHGLLHLKGYPHGTTMEKREQKLLAKLALNDSNVESSGDRQNVGVATGVPRTSHGTTHRNRNRHRDLSGQDRRRRRTRG